MQLTESQDQIRLALLKPPMTRSYDDLLLLKSFLQKNSFLSTHLFNVFNPRQLNEICRSLKILELKKDSVAYNQGVQDDYLYLILVGKCEEIISYNIEISANDREVRQKHGKIFTELELLNEKNLTIDEPHESTMKCLEDTIIITLQKSLYNIILNEMKLNPILSGTTNSNSTLKNNQENANNKETVIKFLSLPRNKRTSQDLNSISNYLHSRIPFFQKFSIEQLIELCRVAETVTINSKSILFKQGQIGQGFYAILSGTVEVWVNNNPNMTTNNDNDTEDLSKSSDLTENLGVKVNQLIVGDIFGERALEHESSMRMASIITGDDVTELFVISKEDYHNLIYIMIHQEDMYKLKILRNNLIFSSLDIIHLKALTRYMSQKIYQIDEEIISGGKKATELIFIESGECRVITQVFEALTPKEQTNSPKKSKKSSESSPKVNPNILREPSKFFFDNQSMNKTTATTNSSTTANSSPRLTYTSSPTNPPLFSSALKKPNEKIYVSAENSPYGTAGYLKSVDLGRIAPNSVLATYVALTENSHTDVYHKETVVAASLVRAFTIEKHNFFVHLPKDSFTIITKAIRDFKTPVLNPLWENTPKVLTQDQYMYDKAWKSFKSSILKNPKSSHHNILSCLKMANKFQILTPNSSDLNLNSNSNNNTNNSLKLEKEKNKKVEVTIDWGKPSSPFKLSHNAITSPTESSESINQPPVDPIYLPNGPSTLRERLSIAQDADLLISQNSIRTLMENKTNTTTSIPSMTNPANTFTKQLLSTSFNNITNEDDVDLTSPSTSIFNHPFALIQIHREFIKINVDGTTGKKDDQNIGDKSNDKCPKDGGCNLASTRRPIKCYLRLCGTFTSSIKAKEYADIQLEQFFLSNYMANKKKENELLLNWTTFHNFENIDGRDTDHFFIYCRSTPIEFASITPSKNLFNSTFPAVCRVQKQRYALAMMNSLHEFAYQSIKLPSIVTNAVIKDKKKENQPTLKQTTKLNTKLNSATLTDDYSESSTFIDDDSTNEITFNNNSSLKYHSSKFSNYLIELSSVSEVLIISNTRFDCIKQAIKKYAVMRDLPLSPAKANRTFFNNNNLNIDTESTESNSITYSYVPNSPSMYNHSYNDVTAVKKKIEYKQFDPQNPDRILKILNNNNNEEINNKKLCVLPLFKWILINDETLETLNLLNCFNEDEINKVLLAEEMSALTNDDDLLLSLSDQNNHNKQHDILQFNTNLNMKKVNKNLIKSFSEVGIINESTSEKLIRNTTSLNNLHLENSHSDTSLIKDKKYALKKLETDLVTREFNKNNDSPTHDNLINQDSNSPFTSFSPTNYERGPLSGVNPDNLINYHHTNPTFSDDHSLNSSSSQFNFASNSSSKHITQNNKNKKFIPIEAKLQTLNLVASERLKVINLHKKHCELEHNNALNHLTDKFTKNSSNFSSSLRTQEQLTGSTELVHSRLDIIESLQKLHLNNIKSNILNK